MHSVALYVLYTCMAVAVCLMVAIWLLNFCVYTCTSVPWYLVARICALSHAKYIFGTFIVYGEKYLHIEVIMMADDFQPTKKNVILSALMCSLLLLLFLFSPCILQQSTWVQLILTSGQISLKGTISSRSEQTFNRAWNRCLSLRWTKWQKTTGSFNMTLSRGVLHVYSVTELI